MIAAAAIAWTATKPAKAFMRRDPSGPPGSRESGKSTFSPVYPASASSSPARPPLPILSLPGRQFVLTTIHRCCCCGCSLLLLYCCGCAAARDDTILCGIRLLLLLTCAAPARRYRRWAPRHRRPAAWATCVAARVATRVTIIRRVQLYSSITAARAGAVRVGPYWPGTGIPTRVRGCGCDKSGMACRRAARDPANFQ
eukprot:COSAG01_NODE_9421_length_2451_cov_1.727466_1_plen_198_part_00